MMRIRGGGGKWVYVFMFTYKSNHIFIYTKYALQVVKIRANTR